MIDYCNSQYQYQYLNPTIINNLDDFFRKKSENIVSTIRYFKRLEKSRMGKNIQEALSTNRAKDDILENTPASGSAPFFGTGATLAGLLAIGIPFYGIIKFSRETAEEERQLKEQAGIETPPASAIQHALTTMLDCDSKKSVWRRAVGIVVNFGTFGIASISATERKKNLLKDTNLVIAAATSRAEAEKIEKRAKLRTVKVINLDGTEVTHLAVECMPIEKPRPQRTKHAHERTSTSFVNRIQRLVNRRQGQNPSQNNSPGRERSL